MPMLKSRDSYRACRFIVRFTFSPRLAVFLMLPVALLAYLCVYSLLHVENIWPSSGSHLSVFANPSSWILHLQTSRNNNSGMQRPKRRWGNKADVTVGHYTSLVEKKASLPPALHNKPVSVVEGRENSKHEDSAATDKLSNATTDHKHERKGPGGKQQESPAVCKWGKYAKWPYSGEFPLLNPYRRKLLYLKVPKTSSSTIAHVLQRHAEHEGMQVGYPDFANNEYVLHEGLARKALQAAGVAPNGHVDAIVSHLRYNSSWVYKLLGTERPFRAASVRDPVSRSWSMYLYGLQQNIPIFNRNATTPLAFAQTLNDDGQCNYLADLGSSLSVDNVRGLASHFDHLLVSSRTLESLVTMAPKLGMRASDLLYFSQKTYTHKAPLAIVSPEEKSRIDAKIRQHTVQDAILHRIANQRLDKELKLLPSKIRQILNDIPAMNKDVKAACGHIASYDQSCMKPSETDWDGGAVCISRCIARWAEKNIYCL